MKLPLPDSTTDLATKLAEFDIWVTPSLGEIRDTDRFREELDKVASVFDVLAETTNQFGGINECSTAAITKALLKLIAGKDVVEATEQLKGAAALLFLCTGKSDNNSKCQLPLHLRDRARWKNYPKVASRKGKKVVSLREIPRTIATDSLMPLIAELNGHVVQQSRLLEEFVRFVLSDDEYVAQLWSIGHSYVVMKRVGHEKALLTPLVIFQVRGSVSASGGHLPEQILREVMVDIGMEAGVDFNTNDVIVSANESAVPNTSGKASTKARKKKTRAYDFVLPFQVQDWSQKIYIQSQYYAGDSGSVSHKNVDQASDSRRSVVLHNENAIFIEYVDGAGYFSSLNGDLKSLLSMTNTHDYFQVRSAPLKLRRALQEIGFLTCMEIEHAIAQSTGDIGQVQAILKADGYSTAEMERAIAAACNAGFVQKVGTKLSLDVTRREIVRRYLLMDVIAINGKKLDGGPVAGYVLVPGYGPFYGLKRLDLLTHASNAAEEFSADFNVSSVLMGDLQWLEERGYIMSV